MGDRKRRKGKKRAVEIVLTVLRQWARVTLQVLGEMGSMGLFMGTALMWAFTPPFQWRRLIRQIHFFGARPLLLIVFTGAFTGLILGLQAYFTLRRFGSEAFLGPGVGVILIRELGPVLSALMITGQVGSALAAEIGIMRITEQIDAYEAMALNPIKYLVVPNLLAAALAFPLLDSIFVVVGIYGGYLVGVELLGVSSGTYFSGMSNMVTSADIWTGVYKSLSFGVIVAWVCCYKGYFATRGAEGVSRATTQAVVMCSVLILVWNYFLDSVLVQ
jgi:phospholipid/cholesterol/gamma-HCH transport system permease protein